MTAGVQAEIVPFPAVNSGTIRVSSGANEAELDVTGELTVEVVRQKMTEILNLSGDHKALLNGRNAGGDTRLRPGDQVEFIREAGVKG